MKEAGKGTNLLLPLGIGAGVLLLLVSMKKKKAEAAATDTTAALPAVSSEEASTPQILPSPAPSYAQAVAKTTQEEDTDDTDDTDEPEDAEQEAALDDTDDDEGESAPSGSNAGYRPSSSINTNQATATLPAYNTGNRIVQNPVINSKAIRFQSEQARAALQKIRNNKATRFQPIPVKKPLVSTIARNINPLFIGKGKPRMGVQIPVSDRNHIAIKRFDILSCFSGVIDISMGIGNGCNEISELTGRPFHLPGSRLTISDLQQFNIPSW